MMIDGPASPIASPMMTKMPVPMTAPMPSAVRSRTPTARLSPCSGSMRVSSTRRSVGLRAKSPGRGAVAMLSLLVGLAGRSPRSGRAPNDDARRCRPGGLSIVEATL
jgi:hypothetical protein